MKRCPYCGEENLDTAAACYYCGRDLPLQQQEDVEPTQPRHVQGRGGARQPNQGPAQPYAPPQPYTPPPGDTQPGAYGSTYGGQQAHSYPTPPTHTGYTQPLPPQGAYPQPQPPYQQQGQYPQQPYQQNPPGSYPQQQPPQYPPNYYPPQQPPAPPERSRLMGMLPVFLGLILLCVCLVAAWVIADTANRGVARLGDQIATRAAGVFAGAPRSTDVPITPLPEEPSPWPTFTPEVAAEPTTSADAGYADKLLSPECRSTLDSLSRMSTQLSEEPLKVLDEAWREGLNQARLNLNFYCGSLDSASPVPGRVEAAHSALNEASTEFDTANQLLQEAVDGRSPAKILEAAQHFGQAARSLNAALAEIRKVVE